MRLSVRGASHCFALHVTFLGDGPSLARAACDTHMFVKRLEWLLSLLVERS